MKHRIYLIPLVTLLLAILSCSLPGMQAEETPPPVTTEEFAVDPEPVAATEIPETETPTEIPIKEPFSCGSTMITDSAFSVEFCYPGAYSAGYSQSRVPENPPSDDLPIYGVHPDMIELTLTSYPVNNHYHEPIVRIYPVADFIALEPQMQSMVNDLQALLTSQDPDPENIPFVPIFNAAQMMQAQVVYFNFQNGQGVRFITQYGQAAMTISNDSAFYAFIGLTDDGAYLISATLPVSHLFFYEEYMTEPEQGWETFLENYSTYISKMEADLAVQPDESFFPDLATLDEMMASFLVPPNAIP